MQTLLRVVKVVCRKRKPREVVLVRQLEPAHVLVRRVPRVGRLVLEVVHRERVVHSRPALFVADCCRVA